MRALAFAHFLGHNSLHAGLGVHNLPLHKIANMSGAFDTPVLSARVVAERSHLAIPSLPNWIEPTVEYLRQKAVLAGACQDTRSSKLLVALHEAVTNAVVHGNLRASSALNEQRNSAFADA